LSPNSLIKPRNFTLLEHLTLGILKLYWTTEVMNSVQYWTGFGERVETYLFKVVDSTRRSRTVTLHTVQYSFKSRYTRPNISKKWSCK
jgi:hypothetical protein